MRIRLSARRSMSGSAAVIVVCALIAAGCSSAATDTADAVSSARTSEAPDSSADIDATTVTTPATTARPTTTQPTTSQPSTTMPDERPPPLSPAELADALTEAELAIRRTDLGTAARPAWARRQQHLYHILSANRPWADDVLGGVDASIAEAVARNWEARLALDALLDTSALSDTVPAWRIEAPAPAEELLAYYRAASDETGVPWEILASINLIETRMGRINGVSTAGAVGPMQFLPSTWADCCVGDPTDPSDAIFGAAKYLNDRGAATDLDRAIFGYNNSDHYVRAVRAYAAVLTADPNAYHGYHGWDVVYLSSAGLLRFPVGYEQAESTDAAAWLATNPDALFDLG